MKVWARDKAGRPVLVHNSVETPITHQDASATPTCDFCEAPHAAFAYPVGAISMGGGAESIPATHWTTCLDCHHLIENADWDGLTIHAGYPPGFAPTPVTAFRDHLRGGAVPLPG
jgi:hypothetical protein